MTLHALLDKAANTRVLCVGDLMLDRFVYGSVKRISPEAPIPILLHNNESEMPGAVGNVARNVSALGASVLLTGAVGDDAEGRLLAELISVDNQITSDLIILRDRATTMKTRYVANGQQLLRVDTEDAAAIDDFSEDALVRILEDEISQSDVVLVSDYAKGVLTKTVLKAITTIAAREGKPVIVDPKGTDFAKYGSVDVLKPNASELSAFIDMPCETDEDIEAALAAALGRVPAKAILVTRSAKGLSYLRRGGTVEHLRGESREVYDVSGAGDTTLAALGLAYAVSGDIRTSADFALVASGIAVTKIGTAAVGHAEIRSYLESGATRPGDGDTYTLTSAKEMVAQWRARGLRIGFTNGCFDILHPGHLSVLEFAKARCDRLIVGVNSDSSVRRLKGPERPVNTDQDRARVLKALDSVDEVVIFEDDTPLTVIEAIKPAVLVKGGDYEIDTIVGAPFVQSYGGEVAIAPLLDGHSTTNILERSRQ